MRRLLLLLTAFLLFSARMAAAVEAVFDPGGSSFFDVPFPHELRRDADGTISVARFRFPVGNAIAADYAAAFEQLGGFGLSSGVFFKFDGDIDPASLPSTALASRQAGASVFLVDIDERSPTRGVHVPLWMEFRSAGDAFRDPHLLAAMPVPGLPLREDTLYAAVVTDGVHDSTGASVTPSAAMLRLRQGAPAGAFEEAAAPLYDQLWDELEATGLGREHVVTATVYRTGRPSATLDALARYERLHVHPKASNVRLDVGRSSGNAWIFTGDVDSPQFQTGAPPFSTAGSGRIVIDAHGVPVVQRTQTLQFVLSVPKATASGTVRMPPGGWPVSQYMHGTGGDRFSFVNDGTARRLAEIDVAGISFDQPSHGLRPGGPGENFYNPVNPYALINNSVQAACDGLVMHALAGTLHVPASTITAAPGAGFVLPVRTIRFDRRRRLFFGHSQGAAVGPLFLGVARGVRGGVISAGGGHLIVNILTREQPFFANLTLRQLVEALLGAPVDLFHPALHLLQMLGEVDDPLTFAPRYQTGRNGAPLDLLFTQGRIDGYVTTPMTAALVAAARYPLVAPTYPVRSFPALPAGYDYQEPFVLLHSPVLVPPVTGNLGAAPRAGTGGMVQFELDGHFGVFQDPVAIAQWQGFVRTLAYERTTTIPSR